MPIEVDSNQIDVWSINLDDCCWDSFRKSLSNEEKSAIAKYRSPRLRDQMSRCRAAVRWLLSEYLEAEPSKIDIVVDALGKPRVEGAEIHFNISHSGEIALLAVSRVPVGVDIEKVVAVAADVKELARVVCNSSEAQCLVSMPSDLVVSYFYRIWTKKESYCKAVGSGIGRDLTTIRATVTPGSLVAMVVDDEGKADVPYYLHELLQLDGYIGCVCTQLEGAIVLVKDAGTQKHLFCE